MRRAGSLCFIVECKEGLSGNFSALKIFTGDTFLPGAIGAPDVDVCPPEQIDFMNESLFYIMRDKLMLLPNDCQILA